MAAGQDGIQKLLAAEMDAQRIVSDARKSEPVNAYETCAHALWGCDVWEWWLSFAGKTDRLRQAKAEAEKEIAAYRAEREGAYQKKVAEVRYNSSIDMSAI